MNGPSGGVAVHIAGRVSDQVFGFLGPATAALAAAGMRQVVVLVDAPRYRHLLPLFDPSVQLVLSPDAPSGWRRWRNLARALRAATQQADLRAVHAHGFMPLLLCAGALAGRARPDMPLYYSPHGSRALGARRLLAGPALWAARTAFLPEVEHPIANVAAEASRLHATAAKPVRLLETPVDPLFFASMRREEPSPVIVGSGRIDDIRSADLVAQMAVLLGDEALSLDFRWIGPVIVPSRPRLQAAGVTVHAVTRIDERARHLAGAWVYVACGISLGFPLHLAEAMAMGLACVAIDTPMHRSLLRDGATGLLCRDSDELLRQVARLVDDPALRHALASAARRDARERFAQARFRDDVLAAYAVGGSLESNATKRLPR